MSKTNTTAVKVTNGKFDVMRTKHENHTISPTGFIAGNWGGIVNDDGSITITTYTHNPNGVLYRRAEISTDGYVTVKHQEAYNDGSKSEEIIDKYFKATTASDISELSGVFMLFDNAKLSVNFKSDEYVELLKKHGIDVVFHKSPNRVYKKPTSKSVVYFDLICDKYGSCEETKSHYIVRNASWVLVARKHEDGTKQTILITKTTDMFSMDLPTHTRAK